MIRAELVELLGDRPGLTKNELVHFLSRRTGLTKVETETVVEGLLGTVQEILKMGIFLSISLLCCKEYD